MQDDDEERPPSPTSTVSEVLLFGMSMEERSRLIQEEELRQTEEELAKAEGLVRQLEGLNLSAPSSSPSALVHPLVPMEDAPDWGEDDELPPVPP